MNQHAKQSQILQFSTSNFAATCKQAPSVPSSPIGHSDAALVLPCGIVVHTESILAGNDDKRCLYLLTHYVVSPDGKSVVPVIWAKCFDRVITRLNDNSSSYLWPRFAAHLPGIQSYFPMANQPLESAVCSLRRWLVVNGTNWLSSESVPADRPRDLRIIRFVPDAPSVALVRHVIPLTETSRSDLKRDRAAEIAA